MSEELKPCPFCGSPASVENNFGREYWVQCTDIAKCGSTNGIEYQFPADAIAAWNRRAQPERKLTDEMPPLPFSPYLRIDWKDKQNSATLYTADQMREYAQKALLAAQPAAATAPDVTILREVVEDAADIDEFGDDAECRKRLAEKARKAIVVYAWMQWHKRGQQPPAAQPVCHDCRVSPDGTHEITCPEAATHEHDFTEMVEKGTKAWAGTPDNWLDELRGNDTPAAQPQDDGEKQ